MNVDTVALNERKPYICEVCGKLFNKYRTLHVHKEMHTKYAKQYNTQYYESDQKVHTNVQSEEESYKYNISFSRADKLKSHMATHIRHNTDKDGEQPEKIDEVKSDMLTKKVQKWHTCAECCKSFHNITTLNRHMKIHSDKDKNGKQSENSAEVKSPVLTEKVNMSHECAECGKSFRNVTTLSRHMKNHSDKNKDDKQSEESDEVKSPMLTKKVYMSHECADCGKSFRNVTTLNRHLENHSDKNKDDKQSEESDEVKSPMLTKKVDMCHKCAECGKSFCNVTTLNRHLKNHSDKRKTSTCTENHNDQQKTSDKVKPHICQECGKRFRRSDGLATHMRTHTGEKPFKCQECGKSFRQKTHLRGHLKHVSHVKREKTTYTCEHCGKCYNKNCELTYHMRTHTGEKPYQCKECGTCFARSDSLRFHERTHTGEKRYSCEECGKSFTRNQGLRHHMRTHTGETPFQCEQCGKCFARYNVLYMHKKTHTGGAQLFKCEECDKCFSTGVALREHVLVHTGETPYKCIDCNKCFRTRRYLTRHSKSHAVFK